MAYIGSLNSRIAHGNLYGLFTRVMYRFWIEKNGFFKAKPVWKKNRL